MWEAFSENRISIIRIIIGAMIIIGFCILANMPVSIGVFGNVWPFAIIWAIAGWAQIGPNFLVTFSLFLIGFAIDIISGTQIGTWSLTSLIALGLYFFQMRYADVGLSKGRFNISIVCLLFVISTYIVGIILGNIPNFIAMIIPLIMTVFLYPLFINIFAVSSGHIGGLSD